MACWIFRKLSQSQDLFVANPSHGVHGNVKGLCDIFVSCDDARQLFLDTELEITFR